MTTLHQSNNPKVVVFLDRVRKTRRLRDSFLANPSKETYIKYLNVLTDTIMYKIDSFSGDTNLHEEATEYLHEEAGRRHIKDITGNL